jgi:hypothetical protein
MADGSGSADAVQRLNSALRILLFPSLAGGVLKLVTQPFAST